MYNNKHSQPSVKQIKRKVSEAKEIKQIFLPKDEYVIIDKSPILEEESISSDDILALALVLKRESDEKKNKTLRPGRVAAAML